MICESQASQRRRSSRLEPYLACPLGFLVTHVRSKREAQTLLGIGFTAHRFDMLMEELTTTALQSRSVATQWAAILSTCPSSRNSSNSQWHDQFKWTASFAEDCGAYKSSSGDASVVEDETQAMVALLPLLHQAQSTLRASRERLEAQIRSCRVEFHEQREQLDFFVEANLSSAKEFDEEGLIERARAKKRVADVERVLAHRLDYLLVGSLRSECGEATNDTQFGRYDCSRDCNQNCMRQRHRHQENKEKKLDTDEEERTKRLPATKGYSLLHSSPCSPGLDGNTHRVPGAFDLTMSSLV